MVKSRVIAALICLAFGLPFLLLADLFPLHRFGMFASLPKQAVSYSRFQMEVKVRGKWTAFKTGNAYFDESYLSTLALEAWGNPEKEQLFRSRLAASTHVLYDSIRWIRTERNGLQQIHLLAK